MATSFIVSPPLGAAGPAASAGLAGAAFTAPAGPASLGPIAQGPAPSGRGEGAAPAPAPDEAAVQRFNRAMAGPLPGDDLAGPQDLRPGEGLQGPDPARAMGRRTVGDAILDGLGSLSRDLQRAWDSVRGVDPVGRAQASQAAGMQDEGVPEAGRGSEPGDALAAGESAEATQGSGASPGMDLPRAGELIALQRSLVEFSFLFEAVGKGTSKAIENTNQLVKMQ